MFCNCYLVGLIDLPLITGFLSVPKDATSEPSETAESIHVIGNFNGEKREPSFATNGSPPALWEASMLRHHFHPSVQAFAVSWLTAPAHSIAFSGDPITEFSITAFLNRFSYKNPKKRNMDKVHRPMPKPEDPINSALFTEMSAEAVAPEKVFFHKYFGARIRMMNEGKIKNRSRKRDDENDEEDGVSDVDIDDAEMDEFADTLAENLMKSTAGNIPDFEGDDEDADIDDDDEDVPDGEVEDSAADIEIEDYSQDDDDDDQGKN